MSKWGGTSGEVHARRTRSILGCFGWPAPPSRLPAHKKLAFCELGQFLQALYGSDYRCEEINIDVRRVCGCPPYPARFRSSQASEC